MRHKPLIQAHAYLKINLQSILAQVLSFVCGDGASAPAAGRGLKHGRGSCKEPIAKA